MNSQQHKLPRILLHYNYFSLSAFSDSGSSLAEYPRYRDI
jgi:hypothetical protein